MKVSARDFFKVIADDEDPPWGFIDEETARKIEDGTLGVFGCQAQIELEVPYGAGTIDVPIQTPGLWGIVAESRQDAYFDDVYADEVAILAEMLRAMGIEVEPDIDEVIEALRRGSSGDEDE